MNRATVLQPTVWAESKRPEVFLFSGLALLFVVFLNKKGRCPMKNKWLIAVSAVGIHICIGSVYAWSVLTKPIMASMGFTLKETTWTFSIAILFLG